MYIVTAYRFNNTHSYEVARPKTEKGAIQCAESHTDYRGGKYYCVVTKDLVEIYRTKIPY